VPLLYVDVLGMKARWQSADLDAVRAAYQTFEQLVGDALDALPADIYFEAGIQSDAAAIVVSDVGNAVEIGRTMFRAAMDLSSEADRFWMRGVIVRAPAGLQALEILQSGPRNGGQLSTRHFSDELLGAVLAEQTGPRGARLLIQRTLVSASLRQRFMITLGADQRIVPFRRLDNSVYPRGAEQDFEDVLWMLPTPYSNASWDASHRAMNNALRWAGRAAATTRKDDEFAHAAATELVFKECDAIKFGIAKAAAERRRRTNQRRGHA
jgi:hypothetical protein